MNEALRLDELVKKYKKDCGKYMKLKVHVSNFQTSWFERLLYQKLDKKD